MARAGGLVLVVEDDDGVRRLIAELLARAGYRIREAVWGEEALIVARQERPKLVLLDVQLPGMSGYDVCRELRAEFGEGLPIVFVSGERTEPYDRVVGLRLGANDYIVKPFAPYELLARVDRLIAQGASDADEAPTPADISRLTTREREVLRLLADGRNRKEIGLELSISRKTISNHIQNILAKLDVHSQGQAVAVAFRSGLFDTRGAGLRR